ncbi:MAG: PQQ-dependent sugar dehydrogenase [Actinomycetota bacterium]
MSPLTSRPRTAIGVGLLATALLAAACGDSSGDSAAVDDGAPASSDASQVDGGGTGDDTDDGGSTDDSGADSDGTSTPAATAPSATDSVWTDVGYSLQPITTLAQPTGLTYRPGDDDLWIIERAGRVRLIDRTFDVAAGVEALDLVDEPIIDLTAQITTEGEGGLLGITFSPGGDHLYLHYTNRDGDNVISEFPVAADSTTLGEERVLLTVPEPFSNHNGGDLAFGPDGMLYISLGDGGAGDDPEDNGQDSTTLLGSILRIDPTADGGDPYTVPADNPFVDASDGSQPEIWVWGLRNPWRMSFDAANGDLWIGDVGQDLMEEINHLPNGPDGAMPGANLGWRLYEGTIEYFGPAPEGHVEPVYAYLQEDGLCSVTGGYVYRGATMPALDGIYLYADFCVPGVTGIQLADDGSVATVSPLTLDRDPSNVISFGQGPNGEIYVFEFEGGVSRIQTPDWPWRTELF